MKLFWPSFCSIITVLQCYATITWQSPPVDISNPIAGGGGIASSDFQAGMDAQGNGVIVWADGTLDHVYSNALISGVWTTPVDVSLAGQASFPVVAVAPNGNAVAIWVDTSTANNFIYGAMKPFGGAWTTPVQVSGPTNGQEPAIGVDANGNAVALWVDTDVFASFLPFGGTWTTPVDISVSPGLYPQVAVASNGNAVAVWQDAVGLTGDILSSSLASGIWSAPIDASAFNTGTVPRVGVDALGNAVAIWTDDATLELFASTLPFGAGAWDPVVNVSNGSGSPLDNLTPRIAVNASGVAIAVWSPTPYSSRLIAGVWETPQLLASIITKSPDVGIAANGDGIIAWRQAATSEIVATTRNFADPSWTTPVNVNSPYGPGSFPELAVSSNGNAAILFLNSADAHVMAAQGFAPPVPSNLKGEQVLHRFPSQGDLINKISWTVDKPIDFFRIYRNSMANLIAVTEKTHFEDHQRKKGKSETYFIVAVDVFGVESAPVSIVVPPKKL